jgi:hypothetical protein
MRRKKSLKCFATQNAMIIGKSKYPNEGQVMTQRASNMQNVKMNDVCKNDFQQSMLKRHRGEAMHLMKRKKEHR